MEKSRGKLQKRFDSRKMKLAFVLVFCALVLVQDSLGQRITLPKEIIELLDKLSKVCQAETGVSDELVQEMKKAKLSDDPKAKCYLKCIMRQLQTMTEDGSLDIDLIEATMPEELKKHGGVETLKKCQHIKEADLCETAYQIMVCFQKENPELTAMFE